MYRLVCDVSKEQTSKEADFMEEVRKHGIDLHVNDTDCHNKSKIEGVIREIQKKWFREMLINKVPYRLWFCGLKWLVDIMHRNAGLAGSLHYHTSLEEVTGETLDISEYLEFSF